MFNIDKMDVLLKEQGISQAFICRALNKRRYFLRDLRAGRTSIKPHEIEIIADALNTTVDYLTDKTETKEKPAEIGRLIADIENSYMLLNEENRKKVDERIAEYISLLLQNQD